MTKPTKRAYSCESKLALVERLAAGETPQDLVLEAGLSSPKLLETCARAYRREGPDALRPKAKGRPRKPDASPPVELELERTSPGERTLAGGSGLLGKIAGFDGAGTTVKVQAPIALKADFPLPVLLQISELARSTFFYHQARLLVPDPREMLMADVMKIFEKNHGR